jgi:hypothetical protein
MFSHAGFYPQERLLVVPIGVVHKVRNKLGVIGNIKVNDSRLRTC